MGVCVYAGTCAHAHITQTVVARYQAALRPTPTRENKQTCSDV